MRQLGLVEEQTRGNKGLGRESVTIGPLRWSRGGDSVQAMLGANRQCETGGLRTTAWVGVEKAEQEAAEEEAEGRVTKEPAREGSAVTHSLARAPAQAMSAASFAAACCAAPSLTPRLGAARISAAS